MTHPSLLDWRLRMRRVGSRLVLAAAILLSIAATVAGAEWREIGSGLPRTTPAVKSLAIDLATPSILYAIDWTGRLFKSTDSGGSWKLRGSVAGVTFAVVDPTDSSTVYAVSRRGIFKSADGGESWAAADSGLAGLLYASMIAIDPADPATLYATTTQGVFKSTDAALSWNKLDTLPSEPGVVPFTDVSYYFLGLITIDRSHSIHALFLVLAISILSAMTKRGILKSTDGGQSWIRLVLLQISTHIPLVIDPITSSTLYAPPPNPMGASSRLPMAGIPGWLSCPFTAGTAVLSLAIDPVYPSTLYAGYRRPPFSRGWGTPEEHGLRRALEWVGYWAASFL